MSEIKIEFAYSYQYFRQVAIIARWFIYNWHESYGGEQAKRIAQTAAELDDADEDEDNHPSTSTSSSGDSSSTHRGQESGAGTQDDDSDLEVPDIEVRGYFSLLFIHRYSYTIFQ